MWRPRQNLTYLASQKPQSRALHIRMMSFTNLLFFAIGANLILGSEVEISDCSVQVNQRLCLNGGTCRRLSSGTTTCFCPLGYEGVSCEILVRNCDPPCLEGKICVHVGNGKGMQCECPDGYFGNLCSQSDTGNNGNLRKFFFLYFCYEM